MDANITVAMISATAGLVVAAVSYYLTKKKEREADWRKYKFEQYKEFVGSMNGVLGNSPTLEGRTHFASACNTLHLIGSLGVLNALHALVNEISSTNSDQSRTRHDTLLSQLIWEIRKDVGIPSTPEESEFVARLWAPNTSSQKQFQ